VNTNKRLPTQLNYPTRKKDGLSLILGISLIVLGIAIGLQSRHSTLLCDRITPTQIECKLLQTDVLGTLLSRQSSEAYLGVLQGADTRVKLTANGSTYQLILLTDQGQTELSDLNQAGDPQELANRINDFTIDRQEKRLELQQDDRWFSSAFGGILVIAGTWKIFTFNQSKPQSLPFLR
jgi:hypothetical protein